MPRQPSPRRIGFIEVQAGFKTFHMKSSPHNAEYAVATFRGAFVGLEWHSPFLRDKDRERQGKTGTQGGFS